MIFSYKNNIFLLSLLFLATLRLQAQYPSADFLSLDTPLLAEWNGGDSFPRNPAFLGKYSPTTVPEEMWNQLRVLRLTIPLRLLAAISNPDSITNINLAQIIDPNIYAQRIAQNTSFYNPSINSIATFTNAARNIYANTSLLIPSLSAAALASLPADLTVNDIEANPVYANLANQMNNDKNISLSNFAGFAKDIVNSVLDSTPLYRQTLAVEFLNFNLTHRKMGLNISFGSYIESHINYSADLVADISALDNIRIDAYDATAIPTGIEFRDQPLSAATRVNNEVERITGKFSQDLLNAVSSKDFIDDNLFKFINSGGIEIFAANELGLSAGWGIAIRDKIHLGFSLASHFFLGNDAYSVPRTELDSSQLARVFFYILNPQYYKFGIHAGLNLGFVWELTPWLNWAILLTDAIGISHSKNNITPSSFGSYELPVDIDTGFNVRIPINSLLNVQFGVDFYDIVDLARGEKHFSTKSDVFGHFRFKASFHALHYLVLGLQLYNYELSLGVRLLFTRYHPSLEISYNFDTASIYFKVQIININW